MRNMNNTEPNDALVDLDSVFSKPYPILAKQLDDGSYDTTIHIVDEIKEPHNFVEAIEVLRAAEDGDVIHLDLCTPGGRLDATMMMLSAMSQTKAILNARISGEVASAGTILALNCDSIEIAPYANFMIHNYSSSAYGKGGEMKSRIEFESKNLEEFFRYTYQPFLTAEECDDVLSGSDIYLADYEIEERFELVLEKREADAMIRVQELQYENDQQRLEDAKEALMQAQSVLDELDGKR